MFKGNIVFVATSLLILFISGCTDENKIIRLREDISKKEVQIHNIEQEISSLSASLDLEKSALLEFETEKEVVRTELSSIKREHPIIYNCIINDGKWTGFAAILSNDQDLIAPGIIIGFTCLAASEHEDYYYIHEKITALNLQSEKISAGLSVAKNELDNKERQIDLRVSEYKVNIESLKTEIKHIENQIACEEDIKCKIKTIIN